MRQWISTSTVLPALAARMDGPLGGSVREHNAAVHRSPTLGNLFRLAGHPGTPTAPGHCAAPTVTGWRPLPEWLSLTPGRVRTRLERQGGP